MHNTNLMASEEKNCYASSSNFLIFNKTDNLFLFKENDISRDYAEKNEIAGCGFSFYSNGYYEV